jgi:hypothetical protein
MASRQYAQQQKNVENGKCRYCSNPLFTKNHCESCAEKVRIMARNRYRKKAGIPLDAPLSPRGRTSHIGFKCVAAQAYQVIGALTLNGAIYSNKEKERALDYFSGMAQGDIRPDEDFLPWG